MKRIILPSLFAAAMAVTFSSCEKMDDVAPATAKNTNFLNLVASLDGLQEVPARATYGRGGASGIYDKSTRQLSLTVTFYDIPSTVTASHIHTGFRGVNGPVTINNILLSQGIVKFGATLSAAQENDLFNGKMYVNVHTSQYPGGEIRGQLAAQQ